MHILFVCTGNICRSPMAEGMMNHLIKQRGLKGITCESAGTHAVVDSYPSKNAIRACAQYDVDISEYKATQLTNEVIARADIVFVMTLQQKIEIVKKEMPVKQFYVPSFGIPDPFGGSLKKYKETLGMINEVLGEFLDGIK